jgi:hypothetical protein
MSEEQGTESWFADRLGKVTASRIADVLAKTKTGYSASRIIQHCLGMLAVLLSGSKPSGCQVLRPDAVADALR